MLTSQALTIGTTASRVAVAGSSPLHLDLHNESGQAVYIGQSDVTSSTGFHIDSHEHFQITLYGGNEIYACTASNTATLICMGQQL